MTPSIKHRAKRNTKPREHKQQLVDMPLDALVEIFLFLEPLDLLHLARTTKGLRAFLLSRRKSSALWKSAISNVKHFPPCPDYISAPAYTHLAFVPVCHGCFCSCETIEWGLRMRCCPNCFPKMTIRCSSMHRNTTNGYPNDLDLPIACSHYKLNDKRALEITVSHEAVNPTNSCSLLDWKVAQSRKRLKKVSIEEFLAQQNKFWKSVQLDAVLCKEWEYRGLKAKAAQLTLVRRQRVKDIEGRLKEMGWIETAWSHYYNHNFLQLPQVRKLEPLTPTEWTEICPQLISWLQGVKEVSVCRYRMRIYDSVLLNIHEGLRSDTSFKVRPLGIDIAMLPAVRSLVESNIHSDMNYDDLKRKFSLMLPLAIRRWSSNAVEELEQFARQELDLPPLSKPSCLPSVIFRCKVCQQRIVFDKALSHEHLYKERRKEHKSTCKMSAYDKLLMEYRYPHPRDIRVLRVDVTVSRRVENLVRRIGQNPSRVTFHDLCRSTVKVVCGLCRPEVATSMVFERAFEHCLDSHLGKKETEAWTRVSAREQNAAISPGKVQQ